jgi:uncharacterized protein involved in oxidation of intracellular sulfur
MFTLVINDAPYGSERTYNGLRLALSLAKSGEAVRVFLMGDAVYCALEKQSTPNGYYNVGRMIEGLLKKGFQVHM